MYLAINGIDITPWIAHGGVQWTRYDIDGSDAGRTLDGRMWRNKVATKIKMQITCIPLEKSDVKTLLNLILPEYVTVTYDDPMYGRVTKEFYSNNNPANFYMVMANGSELWNGIAFPLVER